MYNANSAKARRRGEFRYLAAAVAKHKPQAVYTAKPQAWVFRPGTHQWPAGGIAKGYSGLLTSPNYPSGPKSWLGYFGCQSRLAHTRGGLADAV